MCHIYRELEKEKMKEGRDKGNGTMALTLGVREKYLRFMMWYDVKIILFLKLVMSSMDTMYINL